MRFNTILVLTSDENEKKTFVLAQFSASNSLLTSNFLSYSNFRDPHRREAVRVRRLLAVLRSRQRIEMP